MKHSLSAIFGAVSLACAGVALAQQSSSPPPGGRGLTLPYERGFWGTAGLSVGRGKLDASCPGGGTCDLRETAWRAHAGGRFNNTIGGEVGWIDFGDFTRGGGETQARGLDLKLIAGFPLGENSSIFGKLGGAYVRTRVQGTAAGLNTGRENDWGVTYGIGAQMGLTRNWAVRGDLDRYRVEFPGGGKDEIDTLMIGAQYSFK